LGNRRAETVCLSSYRDLSILSQHHPGDGVSLVFFPFEIDASISHPSPPPFSSLPPKVTAFLEHLKKRTDLWCVAYWPRLTAPLAFRHSARLDECGHRDPLEPPFSISKSRRLWSPLESSSLVPIGCDTISPNPVLLCVLIPTSLFLPHPWAPFARQANLPGVSSCNPSESPSSLIGPSKRPSRSSLEAARLFLKHLSPRVFPAPLSPGPNPFPPSSPDHPRNPLERFFLPVRRIKMLRLFWGVSAGNFLTPLLCSFSNSPPLLFDLNPRFSFPAVPPLRSFCLT